MLKCFQILNSCQVLKEHCGTRSSTLFEYTNQRIITYFWSIGKSDSVELQVGLVVWTTDIKVKSQSLISLRACLTALAQFLRNNFYFLEVVFQKLFLEKLRGRLATQLRKVLLGTSKKLIMFGQFIVLHFLKFSNMIWSVVHHSRLSLPTCEILRSLTPTIHFTTSISFINKLHSLTSFLELRRTQIRVFNINPIELNTKNIQKE